MTDSADVGTSLLAVPGSSRLAWAGWETGFTSLAGDASRAFRSPHELAGLVQAVLGALENDESDWIEWKSGLARSGKDTQGTLARHVPGMANRRPELAARYAAGCGYVIAGAEPGNCAGVAEVDPAVLSHGMESYLGARGLAGEHGTSISKARPCSW